jgi:hypothetical protein
MLKKEKCMGEREKGVFIMKEQEEGLLFLISSQSQLWIKLGIF